MRSLGTHSPDTYSVGSQGHRRMANLPPAYFNLSWQGALELEILCSSDFLVDGFKLYREYPAEL